MKFAFAGTPELASWVLAGLIDRGATPELVLTQPDRPAGRGRACSRPPVADAAERLGVPWEQVANINEPGVLNRLGETGADILVVAAFGQIFRDELLERFLCLNLHPSLLPRWRGAAPIRRSLMAGDETTGVSIIRLTSELDAGPWALRRALPIHPRDDYRDLSRALAGLGALGVAQVLQGMEEGTVEWHEQEGELSYATKIAAEDRRLDFTAAASAVHDRVRALSPDVGAETETAGLRLKVWRCWPLDEATAPEEAAAILGLPGRMARTKHRLWVGCGNGAVELFLVQPQGKRRMTADEFLRGYGGRLGESMEEAADRPEGGN